ncbi:MAG: hypothetical protein ABSA41_12490 [Terriglobia bacterium]|jgi:hypothetical protein
MPKERQEKLPGMPSRSAQAIRMAKDLENTFEMIHNAILPLVEGLPLDGRTVLTMTRKVKGDTIKISFKPGQEG